MRGWDYTSPGKYFVTICTLGKMPWLGTMKNGVMRLSDMGEIVTDEWIATAMIRPNVSLDEWVVMPDHFHGIIVIFEQTQQTKHVVEPPCRAALQPTTNNQTITNIQQSKRPKYWSPGNLGMIINTFKGACTRNIRASGHPDFAWQPRYHDHVIRSNDEFRAIRRYIINNPRNWVRRHHTIT
ncbi:MAG: hypothetical protein WCS85_02950 [Candidatus Peribacteraceae bacterium]|jgi:REP element-mobilizing transposase RayT